MILYMVLGSTILIPIGFDCDSDVATGLVSRCGNMLSIGRSPVQSKCARFAAKNTYPPVQHGTSRGSLSKGSSRPEFRNVRFYDGWEGTANRTGIALSAVCCLFCACAFQKAQMASISDPRYAYDGLALRRSWGHVGGGHANLKRLQRFMILGSFNKEWNLPPRSSLGVFEASVCGGLVSVVTLMLRVVQYVSISALPPASRFPRSHSDVA